MARTIALMVAVLTLIAMPGVTSFASKDDVAKPAGMTVHEWGTFTSVAGADGKVAMWLPLSGPADLPCFVEFENRLFKSLGPIAVNTGRKQLTYLQARSQLVAPIRMETPVLYFYTDQPQRVDVRVAFPKGFITEWYPTAKVNQTSLQTGVLDRSLNTNASINWKNVEVLAADAKVSFPTSKSTSHYYAARSTDANPIRVAGQNEKFLFYRGVGGFAVPINVTVTNAGKINVNHLEGKPHAILFERRGDRLGYTVLDTTKAEIVVDTPALTSNFEALLVELESALVDRGLYAREAKAMVETWRDSWFEEGTRIFYIVPETMVDAMLPLTIEPRPVKVARVFVGRVEVFTPETIAAVERAVYANDTSVLANYGRFLGPILERVPGSNRVNSVLNAAFTKYVDQAARCSN
ncbi:MAG TPA: hypothetical protein VFR18_26070 [Terriglobia bacterium]|nr:hypothetical protein [Terriglobia bacterium]